MVARSLYTVGMRVAFLVAGLLLATGFCPAEVVPNSLFSDVAGL